MGAPDRLPGPQLPLERGGQLLEPVATTHRVPVGRDHEVAHPLGVLEPLGQRDHVARRGGVRPRGPPASASTRSASARATSWRCSRAATSSARSARQQRRADLGAGAEARPARGLTGLGAHRGERGLGALARLPARGGGEDGAQPGLEPGHQGADVGAGRVVALQPVVEVGTQQGDPVPGLRELAVALDDPDLEAGDLGGEPAEPVLALLGVGVEVVQRAGRGRADVGPDAGGGTLGPAQRDRPALARRRQPGEPRGEGRDGLGAAPGG